MSKKLLIAVLLGLLFIYLGNAVAGNNNERAFKTERALPASNPNAPDYGKEDGNLAVNHVQQYGRPSGTGLRTTHVSAVLAAVPKICDTTYSVSRDSLVNVTYVPDNLISLDMLAQKFTLTAPYATCSLKVVWISYDPTLSTGSPDLTVKIWDDGLGYPGTIKGTVTIPFASLPTTAGYVAADFTSQNIVLHANYYVSIETPTVGGSFATFMDNGLHGTGSSYVHMGTPTAQWYTNAELLYTDYNYGFVVDKCCIDPEYSDCYEIDYGCNYYGNWSIPRADGTRSMSGMKFTPVGGSDTLVDVYFYLVGVSQHPDVIASVYPALAGKPDLSNPIFTTTMLWGTFGGGWHTIYLPTGTMVHSDFFFILGGSGTGYYTIPYDNGTCGSRSSFCYNPITPVWQTIFARYGVDYNFYMGADLCKDPYSECKTVSFACTPHYILGLPDSYGDIGMVQPVAADGLGSKLGKVRLPLDPTDYSPTNSYTGSVRVYSNDGVSGSPGTLLGSIAVAPPYPDWTNNGIYLEVDFSSQNIRFDGLVYVGFFTDDPAANYPPPDVYCQLDNRACSLNKLYVWDNVSWSYYSKFNFLIQAEICSFPIAERTCTPGEKWPTSGHDFRRTAASMNSTPDAKCKQVVQWWHTDAAGLGYTRPIIYDTLLIMAYNTKLQAFSINGNPPTPLWTITGYPLMGSTFRNSVTVKDGFVYFGGGTNKGFTKADIYSFPAVGTNPPTVISWSHNPLSALGPLADLTTFTTSVILNIGGTDVVYLTTDGGQVYALNAATGDLYSGWTASNPVQVDGNPWQTLSSNGTDELYVGTDGSLATNSYGSLYAINAATGHVDWQDGKTVLQGVALDSTGTTEEFQAPIAVDKDGAIYVTTSFKVEAQSGAPSGVKYRINPSDGTINWAKGFKFGRYAGPVIDAGKVYLATIRHWTSESTSIEAVGKSSGAVAWTSDSFFDGEAWNEGALSCEPDLAPDILYQANLSGQFMAFSTADGSALFEYNYGLGSARGCGTAIDPSHVVFSNLNGAFFVMQSSTVDRPRLRILTFDELKSVPFFSPDPTYVTYDKVFMNNGCANLTGIIYGNTTPSSVFVTSVAKTRISRMAKKADQMVDNSYADMARGIVKAMPADNSKLDPDFESSPLSKDTYSNTAAYGPPAWLNHIMVTSFDLAPGETFDVQYDVNGPLVTRGPHYCYVTIAPSNEQYYLDTTDPPEVQLGVIGGCVQNQSHMTFGTASDNSAPVMSTGEIGNQEDAFFSIAGDSSNYWQGGFFLTASKYRLAWTTDDWFGNNDFWNSLLPDINLCGDCAVHVTPSAVHLADMSNDGGGTYTAVYGYIAHQRYIDSVVNFGCGGTWDWSANTCPFSDTLSMGIAVNQWMYGVVGVPGLNNVVIYRHDLINRNADSLKNFYMTAFNDFDLTSNKNDILKFNASHSIAWGFSCNIPSGTAVAGMGKIPMDKSPMINSKAIEQAQGMWSTSYVGLDSIYIWASTLTGENWSSGVNMAIPCAARTTSNVDRAQFYTFDKHNFGGHETYSIGTYLFIYTDADGTDTTQYTDLATLVNQLCGFGRGDINSDNVVNLADVVALENYVNHTGNGPKFKHLADVNNSGGDPDLADVIYLANYWFCSGPAPLGAWALPTICPN